MMRTREQRVAGGGKGKIWIAEDFDAPLPDDILATLEEPIEPASTKSDDRESDGQHQ
jgi:hypothetical protein